MSSYKRSQAQLTHPFLVNNLDLITVYLTFYLTFYFRRLNSLALAGLACRAGQALGPLSQTSTES